MGSPAVIGFIPLCLCALPTRAQPDTVLLAFDEHFLLGDAGEDPSPDLKV
jgi:hypothetical protein